LIRTDAAKVIPILKEIALESENPGTARRALFVLAQSERPEARSTVVEMAKTASEPIRLAAIRELGRFGGAEVLRELLQVYSTGNHPVKYQVVTALGERLEIAALLRIAESEADRGLRERAIVTLGRAGGRDELRQLYAKAARSSKRAIIIGLFNARAETELRRIAEEERDEGLRQEAQARLRLLGMTPSKRERRVP
jgi:HEAT repeat protein